MPDLTHREIIIIAGYRAGRSVAEIARKWGVSRSLVTKTAFRLRKNGVYMPFNFTGRSGPNPKKDPPPRFTASGTTPEGCPTSVTSDSQADADAFLAAMEAGDG